MKIKTIILQLVEILLAISMISVLFFLLWRFNSAKVDDKKPVLNFVLILFSAYILSFVFLLRKFYQTHENKYRVFSFLMGGVFVAISTCVLIKHF